MIGYEIAIDRKKLKSAINRIYGRPLVSFEITMLNLNLSLIFSLKLNLKSNGIQV